MKNVNQLLSIISKVIVFILFIIISIGHFFFHKEPSTYDVILIMWIIIGNLNEKIDIINDANEDLNSIDKN